MRKPIVCHHQFEGNVKEHTNTEAIWNAEVNVERDAKPTSIPGKIVNCILTDKTHLYFWG